MLELAKFQVFLLTTKDIKDKIKKADFEYDWKNFFVDNTPLNLSKKTYQYTNLVTEDDPIKWNYKVIWYGRRSHDYKCEPEGLQDENNNNLENKIEKEIISQIN